MKKKIRLDVALQERYPRLSRKWLQSLIMQGSVKVNDTVVTKAGTQINPEEDVIEANVMVQKYVSRAGYKLEKALEYFNIDVTDAIALDAGISTGGFTDCLLQHGAKKVYGIDVGYGQVHEKIRIDPRVEIHERTNLRRVDPGIFSEPIDIVTLDLSFISVLKVIPIIAGLLEKGKKLVVLIKPQFEAERHNVGKGGIIKDEKIHEMVIEKVKHGIQEFGFECQGIIESPIFGGSGNKEFLGYFIKK